MMKKVKPNKQTKLICAQIRIGGDGDFTFTNRENSKRYWEFIQRNLTFKLTNYKLFITTDTSSVIDEANNIFRKDTVVAFKERSFHLEFRIPNVEKLSSNECDRISLIYLEFLMLGQCDYGVVSQSGFGLVGILNRKDLKDLKNFYVFTNLENLKKSWSNRNDQNFIPFKNLLLYVDFKNFLE